MDLSQLLTQIQGHVLVPKIAELQNIPNDKKPRAIAELLVRHLHKQLTNPVSKDVLHDGEIHRITYFDIEPLLRGSWAQTSLLLLHLSYGEQTAIIDALYPKDIQLTAKAFAINFTPDVKTTNIKIENDNVVVDKLESANIGIAMIMAMLQQIGYSPGHIDQVTKNKKMLQQITQESKQKSYYQEQMDKVAQANHYQDKKG